MAGGTWTKQNKQRPGAYINAKAIAQAKHDTSLGRVLLIGAIQTGWGAHGVIPLEIESDFKALLGTTIDDPRLVAVKEALKGAVTVLYVNMNPGEKAKVSDAALPWNFTAKYAGTKGNDLTISVEKDPNDETLINVNTLFGTELVAQQQVRTTTASGLESNPYVDVEFTGDATEPIGDVSATTGGADFSATAGKDKLEALATSTTYNLTGGTTESADDELDLVDEAMSTEAYNVVTTAGIAADNALHKLVATTTERLREKEGYKIRAVVPALEGGTKYDYEGVSVVNNGVTLADGTELTATQAAGWFAGASSAANETTSLTYAEYPDAVAANPKRSNEQTIDALNTGQVVFTTRRDGTVVVEQDINSLVTETKDKSKDFRKNRVIRTLDAIAMDTSNAFESRFLGKIANNATGRDLFKSDRVSYLKDLQTAGGIDSFEPADLTVSPGDDKDAILVTLGITPVDAMEKLYMTITVG